MTGWILYIFVALASTGNAIQIAKKHGASETTANRFALLVGAGFLAFGVWLHYYW